MSGAATRSAMSANFESLKSRFSSPDYDIRQQTLIDFQKDIRSITETPPSASSSSRKQPPDTTYCDEHTENKFVPVLLKIVLEDENAEVKNEAVKCIELVASKSRPAPLQSIVKGLLDGLVSDKDEVRNIACPALKKVAQAIPHNTPHLPQTIELILTRIFSILAKTSPPPDSQIASELLQILRDVFVRYPHIFTSSSTLQTSSTQSLLKLLSSTRNAAIRKRTIEALPALVATNPTQFNVILKKEIIEGLKKEDEIGNAWVGLVAALAKEQSVVSKIGAMVGEGHIADQLLEHTANLEQVEAVEGALVALDALILRCPTEITPYIAQILQRSLDFVKYDPNYVELDDEDDVDMNDEDEDDDYDDDAYSDEEDISWKIRRAAAKVISALIGTRNELIIEFYKTAAPVLISRFSEREESVRLEILSAFEILLRQTAQIRAAEMAAIGRNKRKRSQGMDEDDAPEDSPITYLSQLFSQLLRAILKQISSKSVPTRQQCFVLLRQTDEALGGGLEGEADAICKAATSAIRSVDSATSSSLAMAALSFLAVFFRHHSARVYASHLSELVPAIVRCIKDKLQRVNFEAFAASSSLAQSLRPKGSASPLTSNHSHAVQQLFDATTQILNETSVDGEVRERALDTLGHLLVHEGDALTLSYPICLPLITARLGSENTALTAVNVIGRIASSSTMKGEVFEQWLLSVLPEVVTALRKTRRSSSKNAEFSCLQAVLTRVGGGLPATTASDLTVELKPFIETPLALSTASLILRSQPAARGSVVEHILPSVLASIKVPSVNPHVVDALAEFFAIYVQGDSESALQIVPALVNNLGRVNALPDATQGGTSVYSTTARCVGSVVENSQDNASKILATFEKTINSSKSTEADVYLALLCIGEIGRVVNLSKQASLFDQILQFFGNESEEVRSAAAFAAGNLAVGSPDVYLPEIIKRIQAESTEASRLLLLHALKEVILHSPSSDLEDLADSLWASLFAEDVITTPKAKPKAAAGSEDIGDDGIRNIKAACVGKLTTTAPAKFLPQLQTLLHSSPRNRAIVAAAVRYTFIDTSSAYDELISPIIVDFLSLMHDENLIVRRLSLASLNAAIQNKPHLIVDRLTALQPLLYQETVIKSELQREVQMGPWKVMADDGLENRKTAYETMYTLLGTCFSKVDLPTFTDRVMAALKDVNEIRVLGLMLLLRLGQLSPASVIPRLDDAAEALKVIMKDLEVKDDTVKQDLERKEEMQRTTLRTAIPLYRMSHAKDAPAFHSFVGGLLTKSEWKDFRDYQG